MIKDKLELLFGSSEYKTMIKWLKSHDCKTDQRYVVGYYFGMTPIGTKIEVTCHCGEVKDITSYESW